MLRPEAMGKRASAVTGVTRDQRKRLRRRLGSFRDNLVKSATRERYTRCFHLFIRFLKQQLGYLPATPVEYDAWLARYIEYLWHEGESKSVASLTLAGIQFFVPQLRKQLTQSWKLKAKSSSSHDT